MNNKVQIKRSSVAAKVPLAADLDFGELAINYTDGRLYYKDNLSNVKSLLQNTSNVTRDRREYTGDGVEDTFAVTYSSDHVNVFFDGELQDESLYTATSGTTILFGSPPANGVKVTIIGYELLEFTDLSTSGLGLSYNPATHVFTLDSTSNATGDTVVYRNSSGNFSANEITANLIGNADTASAWETPRTLTLAGDVTGSVSIDGSGNVSLTTTVGSNNHSHDSQYLGINDKADDSDKLDGLNSSQFLRSDTNDFMAGQLYGGFGALTTSGSTNWNDATNARSGNGYTLLLGSATNGPPSAAPDYFHPFSFEYNSKDGTGNMSQLAVGYATQDLYMRNRYSNSWNSWTRFFSDIYHPNADKLTTPRTISLSGDASGSASFDGSNNVSINVTVSDDSHDHTYNIVTKLTSGDDLNDFITDGLYAWNGSIPSNSPGNNSYANMSVQHDGSQALQMVWGGSSTGNAILYIRRRNSGTWNTWTRMFSDGYHPNADKLTTARTISLSGDATGSIAFDGSGNVTIPVVIGDNNHSHDSQYLGINDKADDSNLLDGINSSSFFRSDANDTRTGYYIQTDQYIRLNDSVDLRLGTSNDFRMDFTGTQTVFRSYSHGAVWQLQGEDAGGTNRTLIHADPDSDISLYYQGTDVAQTTATGLSADTFTGNATSASKWQTPRTLTLTGDVTGAVVWDGSSNVSLTTDISDINDASARTITFDNLEADDITSDGMVGFDSSRGLIIYRTQEIGDASGDGTYTVLDSSNIQGGANITISGNATDESGSTPISFAVDQGSGSGLDADLLDGYDHTAFNPVVLNYRTSSTTSTRLKIRLPWTTSSSRMVKFTISQYSGYTPHDYVCSGYLYATPDQWHDPRVVYSGAGTPDIIFGRDTDGQAYVSIANSNYTGVIVHSVTVGYSGTDADMYNQGWSAAVDATTPNTKSHTTYTPWTASNDGSGSGLDADLVDGLQASQFLRSDVDDTLSGRLNLTDTNTYIEEGSGDSVRLGTSTGYIDVGAQNTSYAHIHSDRPIFHFNQDMVIDNGTSTSLTLLCDNSGSSVLNLYGASQGTGAIYVGQSATHGGGIEYNGDNSPSTTGAGADQIALYRRDSGVDSWTAKNSYASNDWYFRGNLYANSSSRVFADNYHPNADTLTTSRTISLTGDVTGSVSFNGSSDVSIAATVGDDSHSHTNYITSNATDTVTGHTEWQDTYQVRLGNSADMKIYHSGGLNYIDCTQDLLIRHGTEVMARFYDDASVHLFHNSVKKFETSSAGATVTGDLTVTGTLYETSDIRLKENIEPLESRDLSTIKPVTFNKKISPDIPEIGFIAQDVEREYPELVDTDDDGFKAVNYSRMTAVLLQKIQELEERIIQLES